MGLQDKAFGGDIRKLNGYYSYIGNSLVNWEERYFGDHVDRLKEIKYKYDPAGLFDKPFTISGSNANPLRSATTSSSKKGSKKSGKVSVKKTSKKASKKGDKKSYSKKA